MKPSDRRLTLFGRRHDVDHLVLRAKTKGLTAVVGRPQMGKSWSLTHVAWLLGEKGYVVGYEESGGPGADLLLHAVADLYTFWLSNASYREQAKSLWRRHKDELITSIGCAVGAIVEPLSKAVGLEILGKPIREILETLARAEGDLRTGGVTLPKLDYQKARELVNLVCMLSQKPVVLFLDAWEKSSVEAEYMTLDGFLNHLDDWPPCHIFLGLRQNNPAWKKVQELKAASPEADIYQLPPMDLGDDGTRHFLVEYLGDQLTNLKAVTDAELLKLIGDREGFPGVINRWLSDSHRTQMASFSDLKEVADAAQQYRYFEFDELLPLAQTMKENSQYVWHSFPIWIEKAGRLTKTYYCRTSVMTFSSCCEIKEC